MSFAGMSQAEMQFIRLYVATLRREYYLLRSVMDLMHPSGLGLKSFIDATNAAVALDEMHQDFEANISRIQKKRKMRKIAVPQGPTTDELADMFSLSFFKLVTVTEKPNETGVVDSVKQDDGWFSGKPAEWKKTLALYKNTPKSAGDNLPNLLSNFLATLLKFFPFEPGQKDWHKFPFGTTKKLWPPQNNYIEDEDEQYFDEDDEDDGMSEFDMFFGNDDDDE
jgi:hypothetical protein